MPAGIARRSPEGPVHQTQSRAEIYPEPSYTQPMSSGGVEAQIAPSRSAREGTSAEGSICGSGLAGIAVRRLKAGRRPHRGMARHHARQLDRANCPGIYQDPSSLPPGNAWVSPGRDANHWVETSAGKPGRSRKIGRSSPVVRRDSSSR